MPRILKSFGKKRREMPLLMGIGGGGKRWNIANYRINV